MTSEIEYFRKQAKKLKKNCRAGDPFAIGRILNYQTIDDHTQIMHARCLHVIACEQGFIKWNDLIEHYQNIEAKS